jgi:aldehyde:ferredoxin oxidoreductase
MKAYAGKILHVNLTSGRSRTEVLDEKTAKLYLGGVGLGIHLLMEHSKIGKDAFDPDTPLIYCTGPLSGTLGLAGSGYVVVSKSPLTGCVGEGQVQSFFGSELKRAGYDAVVVTGRAAALSYLWIDDDAVQVCDASHLSGFSVGEVEQSLRSALGDFSVRVSGIGVAGEKLCRFATIVSDTFYSVGRGGLGAVMGSKNLKAIVVRGTRDVNVEDFDAFARFVKFVYGRVKNLETGRYQPFVSKNLLELNSLSAVATRNWGAASFEGVAKLDAEFLGDRYVKRLVGCATCGLNCNSVAVVSDGFSKDVVSQVDFACILSLGPLCSVDRFDVILKAVSLINAYGMDCISVGAAVAFAMDLYEQGILTSDQVGDVDLRFGNAAAILDLIDKIGKRDGWLGNVLAEGVAKAAETIGGEAFKYACHVKGLELPGYDFRTLKNAALGFSVTFSGDRHQRSGAELLDLKGDDKIDRYTIESGVGNVLVDVNHRYNVLDSLILCKLTSEVYTWQDLADYYLFATGIKITEEELQQVGERVENLARLFNILEGKGTRIYDNLPYKIKHCPVSVKDSKQKDIFVSDDELELGLDDYYVACGWTADGIPTVDRLKQVGLGALAYISENAITAARTQQEEN